MKGARSLRSSSSTSIASSSSSVSNGSAGRSRADHSVKPPGVGHTLELALACSLEDDPGTGGEVIHGRGDEHLGGTRERSNPRPDVDGDAADFVAVKLHFAGVHAG